MLLASPERARSTPGTRTSAAPVRTGFSPLPVEPKNARRVNQKLIGFPDNDRLSEELTLHGTAIKVNLSDH
jgi:hypothetical protein